MLSTKLDRRDFMKTAAVGALVAGTGFKAQAATPKKGGTLRFGTGHGSTSDTMDPAIWENDFVIGQAYAYSNYLTVINANNELEGEIAETFEGKPGAAEWVLKIRKGVEFHNGKTLTPDDVVASINYHRGDESKSAAKGLVNQITDIKVDGDNVVFSLSGGNADFPYILSDYHLVVLPSSEGKIDPFNKIGCGAYVIDTFDPGVRGEYSKHKNYWKSDAGHFDKLQRLVIADTSARTNALLSGEIDAMDRVDLKTARLMKKNKDVVIEQTNGAQHYTMPMLSDVAPFDNVDVRRALKFAINREEMVQKILFGYGTVGNDHPIGQATPFYAKGLEQTQYDPDKAKFHLKQAGLTELSVQLHMADAAFAGAVDAGVLYSETAKNCGINIEVVREPNDGYWSNVWMAKPFCGSYWGGRPTVDWMLSQAYTSEAEWNESHWRNPAFDKILVEARAELDVTKRAAMYFDLQKMLRDDGGSVIPMFSSYVFARSTKLEHGPMASNWDMDGHRFTERWWFA